MENAGGGRAAGQGQVPARPQPPRAQGGDPGGSVPPGNSGYRPAAGAYRPAQPQNGTGSAASPNGRPAANGSVSMPSAGTTHAPATNHRAEVVPIRDASDVACEREVELVVLQFASFGRLAHLRRVMSALPHVEAVRITHYEGQTAFFAVRLRSAATAAAMTVPGTRLVSSNGRRVELCADAM